MKILFLGQNPSLRASKLGEKRAFFNTRSGITLFSWIKKAGIPPGCYSLDNTYPAETPGNSRPKLSDVDLDRLRTIIEGHDGVVALGKFAASVLKKVEKDFQGLKMAYVEHPSGLNRNLNSKDTHEKCVLEIRKLYEALRV